MLPAIEKDFRAESRIDIIAFSVKVGQIDIEEAHRTAHVEHPAGQSQTLIVGLLAIESAGTGQRKEHAPFAGFGLGRLDDRGQGAIEPHIGACSSSAETAGLRPL